MSKIQVTSTIQAISPIETIPYGDGKEFKKRTLVLTDNEDAYNDVIVFELGGKSMDIVDGCNVGDTVTVHGNVSCRENKNKAGQYFTSLKAWKIDKATATAPDASPAPSEDIPF